MVSASSTYKRDGVDVTDPVLSDGAAAYTPGISERRSSATSYAHQDQLGSVTRLTDSSQATTATKTYDAFGNLVASTGTTPTPFGFAGGWGYQSDADSGLQLLGHRYYDPSTGRFLTRDPARDGRNWYVYCDSDPLDFYDDDGLSEKGDRFAAGWEEGVGQGPRDCGHYLDKWGGVGYPGPVNTWPSHFKKHPEGWKQIPNNGDLQPGDVICIRRPKKAHGHVRGVGNRRGKDKKTGKPTIDIVDASIPNRPGTRHEGHPIGTPISDKSGDVTIWRSKDPVKHK